MRSLLTLLSLSHLFLTLMPLLLSQLALPPLSMHFLTTLLFLSHLFLTLMPLLLSQSALLSLLMHFLTTLLFPSRLFLTLTPLLLSQLALPPLSMHFLTTLLFLLIHSLLILMSQKQSPCLLCLLPAHLIQNVTDHLHFQMSLQ